MSKRISPQFLFIEIYSFLLFTIGIVNLRFRFFTNISIAIVFLITLLLSIANYRFFVNKVFNLCVIFIIIYFCLWGYTAYINSSAVLSAGTVSYTLKYFFIIFSFLFGFNVLINLNDVKSSIENFFYFALIYCIVNDTLFMPHIATVRVTQAYFLGNKFNVAYMHVILLAFYLLKNNLDSSLQSEEYPKKGFYALLFLSLIVDILINCFTGIVGLFSFLLFYIFMEKNWRLRTIIWTLLFIGSSLVPMFYLQILNSNFYQYFVIDKLGRSITMTGRMNVYEQIPQIMFNHWQWGYGYGTSYSVVEGLIEMPNTQNGTLEIILQGGIWTTIVFFCFILFLVIMSRNRYVFPIISLVCMFTLVSAFEITYSVTFVSICIVAVMLSERLRPEFDES